VESYRWEDAVDGTAALDELIAEACGMVGERPPHPPVALALVHDELAAAAATCDDAAAVADAGEVLAELERAVADEGGGHGQPIAS
jgi:hypothetical protein